ncbi:flagellar protein [candidate division KSB1 bacterium]|nr:MAG: flagellar protein [candidate division KSB1 bacterium]
MIDAIRRLPPIPGASGVEPTRSPIAPSGSNTAASRFDEELASKLEKPQSLNFSAHAQNRLLSRSIQLTNQQIARLENGVSQAAQKGARDSLVMLDNLAFIVSVSNRTVVTAVDSAMQNGNVFTQIDSAVIA